MKSKQAYNRLQNAFMLNDDEIDVLLVVLCEHYGYNFNYYSRDSLRRRLSRIFRLEKFASFDEFLKKIKSKPGYIEHVIDRITVNITEMFRDHDFFRELRTSIIPTLSKLPQINLWHPGCSSGEEAYSTAILLHEAGLLHKSRIVATDINPLVIEKARQAVYPLSLMSLYSQNYTAAGGERDFDVYYSPVSTGAKLKSFLSNRITFLSHNLASNVSPGVFNCIICRNVLIYFDKELRERTFVLFDRCLPQGAYLALGEKETLRASGIANKYKQEGKEKIWRKIG